MKYFIKQITLYTTILALTFTSCEVVDVTDVDPVFQIDEENVITDIAGADRALKGVYSLLIANNQFGQAYVITLPGITTTMGLTQKPGVFAGSPANETDFFTNEARPDNGYIADYYPAIYKLINNANHVIEKTTNLETDDSRKGEIIAEAKFLRALSHFYLLRLHGEFFDIESTYGVVLKSSPIENSDAQPRATVEQSYQFILDDLDDAILNAPSFSTTIYASKLAAKSLKSKVLLYKKDYAEAAVLAEEVINSGLRSLETEFADVFAKKITDPFEAIFQSNYDDFDEYNNKQAYFAFFYALSDDYVDLLSGDARYDAVVANAGFFGLVSKKFTNPENINQRRADTEYFLRLAEMYLIYAEAILRSDNSENAITIARDNVNIIRERAGNPLISTTERTTLLEEIRMEKLLELGAESGEEWFDLVRYHKEGDLNINDIKPLPSEANLILPMPRNTVLISNNVVEQNPGY